MVVAELVGVVAPNSEGAAAPDCSAGFAPKSGFEGDCPAAGAAGLAGLNGLLPPKLKLGGGVKAFPLPKIEGFDPALPFASGDVCMESSPPIACPTGDGGFCGLVWPTMPVEGAGAGLPNRPVVGVGPDDGAVVVVLPNRPPEGRGC